MTKYIGEALKETTRTQQSHSRHAVCVGITPWNNVTNRKELVGRHYLRSKVTINAQDTYLDSNHTHFLLVDNNYAENNHNLIDLSANLVTMMRKLQYEGTIFFSYASVFLEELCCEAYLFTLSLTLYLNLIRSRKCEFISYYVIRIF